MAEEVDIYDDATFGGDSTPQHDSNPKGESNNFLYDDIKEEDREDREESSKRRRRDETPDRDRTPDRERSPPPRHPLDLSEYEGMDLTQVYIGNMTWWTSDKDIEDLFSPFGRIKSLKFFEDKLNGKSKGYALIEFSNKESSIKARESLNGKEVHGRQVIVNFATPESLKEINKLVQQTKVQSKKPTPTPGNPSQGKKTGPVPAIPSFPGGGAIPMEMMGMMPPFRGGGGRPTFPMVAVPDPRMLVSPHVNPAFFRRDGDRERDRDKERDRSRSPPDDRRYKRDRDDRHHRDDYDRDDRKRHKDHRSSRH